MSSYTKRNEWYSVSSISGIQKVGAIVIFVLILKDANKSHEMKCRKYTDRKFTSLLNQRNDHILITSK